MENLETVKQQMCGYHNRELVLYEGVFVCDKCLAKYYGIRLHQQKAETVNI